MMVSNATSRIAPQASTSAAATRSETVRLGRGDETKASGSIVLMHASGHGGQAEGCGGALGLPEDEDAAR